MRVCVTGTILNKFLDLYVVARVRAAREEMAGGPFMDVALTEQIQTLQDLNFRHLLCTFETTEEEGAGEAILCLNFLCFSLFLNILFWF